MNDKMKKKKNDQIKKKHFFYFDFSRESRG